MKKWIPVSLVLLVLLSGCLTVRPEVLPDNPSIPKMTLKGLEFHTNLTLAFDEARAQDKPLFVYLRSENCGWCRKFESETFTDKEVIRILNENFISVSIDVNRQKEETRSFRVRGTPTEIFLGPDGTEITRIPGYTDTGTFLSTINDITNRTRPEK